ncbi:MAG: hypothetical protein QOE22_690 [Candidatus Parcubacteria bacterium]|jgi:hypothetical protein|nr:hypothetical protein [Candidatus Parcubacteria bacterium]
MALRIRKNGQIYCAAKTEAEEDDTYIHDGLHYELSVIQKTIVPAADEDKTGRWFWLHGECQRSDHPDLPKKYQGCYVRADSATNP